MKDRIAVSDTRHVFFSPEFLAQLERLSLLSRRAFRGSVKGERRSPRRGHSVEFADYRAYGHGDDLRYVDWNIYGRLDRLHVKLFVDEEDLCLHLLIDASASMGFGVPSKLEYGTRVAAALGFVGLVSHERVGVGILRARAVEGWPPTRGRNEALGEYALRAREPGLAVVVSDLLDPQGFEAGVRSLLERRFDVHVIHVLDPTDLNPDLAGDLRLHDAETGEARDVTVDGEALRGYRERLARFLERVEAFCRSREVGYHRVSTETPVEEFVVAQLRGRFDAARSEAASLVRRLGEGAEIMVIEAGVQPHVTAALGRDRDRALSAIRAARPRDLPQRLPEALRTARALVGIDPRAEIHVFTDGAFVMGQTPEMTDPRIRWVGVGRRGYNVGIVSLSIRKTYYGSFGYQAFVSLVNHSPEAQTFDFALSIDDQMIAEKSLTLEPSVRRSIVLPFAHQGGGTVTAKIGVNDDLATDNVAYAVIPPPKKIAVTLVSPGNRCLEKVLRTDPTVALEVKTPEQYQGGMGEADVVVLDSSAPPKVGPGRYVFVNTVPPDVPLEVLGRIEAPTVMDWDRAHPVMRHVEFAKVAIQDAMRVRPLAAGRALVEAVGGPLLYALEEPDRKAIFIGFDLFKTDFPLRVAFPLILSNTLRWLHPAALDQSSLQLAAGQPILLPVAHGISSATVNSPSGRAVKAPVTRGVVSFTDTDEVGIYTLSTARGDMKLAVNLGDGDESDITPHALPTPPPQVGAASPPVPIQRELWPLFVLVAVVLLALEGVLYWRRQTGGRLRVPSVTGDQWALALRGALVVVLLVTLLRPTLPRWVDRLNVVFLLDHSDSVSLVARERAYRFVAQAGKHPKR